MAQCQGKTKRGERCKRDARSGSDFCTIHMEQAVRPRETRERVEWDSDAILKAVLGFALVGVIFFFRFRR